jgi:hypothetical protein
MGEYKLKQDFHIVGLDLVVDCIRAGTYLDVDYKLKHIYNFRGSEDKYCSISVIEKNPDYFEKV